MSPRIPDVKKQNGSDMCSEALQRLLTSYRYICLLHLGSTLHPISREPSRLHSSPGLDTRKTLEKGRAEQLLFG